MSGSWVSAKAKVMPSKGGNGGTVDAGGRLPLGALVFEKGQGGMRKYHKWLEREGVIIPSIKNEVVYLTPALVKALNIDGIALFARFADGKFLVCNTHKSDKNGYVVEETGNDMVYKVSASAFVKKLGLMGEDYYFYPVLQIRETEGQDPVAVFNPRDRQIMDV